MPARADAPVSLFRTPSLLRILLVSITVALRAAPLRGEHEPNGSPMNRKTLFALAAGALLAVATTSFAQEKVLNLYSARHYPSDQLLYDGFTKQTGIQIRRIEAGDEALLERMRNEGANS